MLMRVPFVTFVMLAGFGSLCGGQTSSTQAEATSDNDAVQITHGPVVENVTDTTAIIAWSTNVNAGTLLRYGTDPQHLGQTASMPWGGLTHRVSLKDLKPGTTYYFQAESGEGQGTGTMAQAPMASFQTKPSRQGCGSEPSK
jgi:hypothetical protein